MQKIQDRIILGLLAGIMATLPSRLLNRLENRFGLTDANYNQMAANLFLSPRKAQTPEGRMTGAITNHINTGLTGVLITYLLSFTGRDKAVIKGAGTGAFMWMAVFGIASKKFVPLKPQKPLAPLLSFIDHVIFGALCGLTVSKLGDDSLFPDGTSSNKNLRQHKSPAGGPTPRN